MLDEGDAVQVERSAAAAWPASRTETMDGWLLRHTPGVSRRRSNSALPPAADRSPERALDAVEAFYRAAGLPATVQVSPAERQVVLDATLAARGYRREAPTLVLTAPAADVARAAAGRPRRSVTVEEAATAGWLGAYQALNGPVDTSAVAERVLARVPAPAAFARVTVDGAEVAIGLFVAGVRWDRKSLLGDPMGDAVAAQHAVERAPLDAEDGGGAADIAAVQLDDVLDVAVLELLEGGQIGEEIDRLRR